MRFFFFFFSDFSLEQLHHVITDVWCSSMGKIFITIALINEWLIMENATISFDELLKFYTLLINIGPLRN